MCVCTDVSQTTSASSLCESISGSDRPGLILTQGVNRVMVLSMSCVPSKASRTQPVFTPNSISKQTLVAFSLVWITGKGGRYEVMKGLAKWLLDSCWSSGYSDDSVVPEFVYFRFCGDGDNTNWVYWIRTLSLKSHPKVSSSSPSHKADYCYKKKHGQTCRILRKALRFPKWFGTDSDWFGTETRVQTRLTDLAC